MNQACRPLKRVYHAALRPSNKSHGVELHGYHGLVHENRLEPVSCGQVHHLQERCVTANFTPLPLITPNSVQVHSP